MMAHPSILISVTTAEALIRLLTRFAGIAENEHRPLMGTRRPLQASIRHAFFSAFRDKMRSPAETACSIAKARNTSPDDQGYDSHFLGAVDEDHFLRHQNWTRALITLRDLKAPRFTDVGLNIHCGEYDARMLDARRVGLIEENFESTDVEIIHRELRRVLSTDLKSPIGSIRYW